VKLAAMERENLNKQTIIQVLDEIGIEVSGKVREAPAAGQGKIGAETISKKNKVSPSFLIIN